MGGREDPQRAFPVARLDSVTGVVGMLGRLVIPDPIPMLIDVPEPFRRPRAVVSIDHFTFTRV